MMGSDDAFCLKWNDFQGSISSSLGSLRTTSDLLDVTLQCGRETLQCHRLVLSACSDWFKTIFRTLPSISLNPVIVLWEASAKDMSLLLDFMYNGEVNVKQENLNSFLALAEKLSVRGLTQSQGSEGNRSTLKQNQQKQLPQSTFQSVRNSEDKIESQKKQRLDQILPAVRHAQQEPEVEEIAVVKQEISREIEPVDQSEEGFDNYQQSEVGQYDNMYDGYYEGDESSQNDYSHLDNSLHVGSSKGEFFNGPGVCPYCNKNVQNLAYHVEDKHFPNPTPCPICGKVCDSLNKMRVHKSRNHKKQN